MIILFQGQQEGDPVVQVALISESIRLQLMLNTYSIQTQTPFEVEPVQIWPRGRLVSVSIFLALFLGNFFVRDENLNLSLARN